MDSEEPKLMNRMKDLELRLREIDDITLKCGGIKDIELRLDCIETAVAVSNGSSIKDAMKEVEMLCVQRARDALGESLRELDTSNIMREKVQWEEEVKAMEVGLTDYRRLLANERVAREVMESSLLAKVQKVADDMAEEVQQLRQAMSGRMQQTTASPQGKGFMSRVEQRFCSPLEQVASPVVLE